jgi:rhodanese-related sulfurtransferase
MKNPSRISPREAYAAYIMGTVLVDVREPKDSTVKYPGVNNLVAMPFQELSQRYNELPANRPMIVMSNVGAKGREAAAFLMEHGYNEVSVMDGGLRAWEEEGLPIK